MSLEQPFALPVLQTDLRLESSMGRRSDSFRMSKNDLLGGFNPSEKYESVSWDDDIPNIWKVRIFMFQTTNQWFMVGACDCDIVRWKHINQLRTWEHHIVECWPLGCKKKWSSVITSSHFAFLEIMPGLHWSYPGSTHVDTACWTWQLVFIDRRQACNQTPQFEDCSQCPRRQPPWKMIFLWICQKLVSSRAPYMSHLSRLKPRGQGR